jgi:protein SCO1
MRALLILLVGGYMLSCKPQPTEPLPYVGPTKMIDGVATPHKIDDFAFVNQTLDTITPRQLSSSVYVADFFFTSCPSICPKVMKEMLKIYDEVKSIPDVKMVSFTLDPKRDTPDKLKLYADNLGVDHKKWYFLNGDQDKTLELANQYYLLSAFVDATAPGGFDHSGKLILVDKDGHIRSFSEGTDPSETPKIIRDIHRLLDEYKK